VLFCQV